MDILTGGSGASSFVVITRDSSINHSESPKVVPRLTGDPYGVDVANEESRKEKRSRSTIH
jgi:hypothetical protein